MPVRPAHATPNEGILFQTGREPAHHFRGSALYVYPFPRSFRGPWPFPLFSQGGELSCLCTMKSPATLRQYTRVSSLRWKRKLDVRLFFFLADSVIPRSHVSRYSPAVLSAYHAAAGGGGLQCRHGAERRSAALTTGFPRCGHQQHPVHACSSPIEIVLQTAEQAVKVTKTARNAWLRPCWDGIGDA